MKYCYQFFLKDFRYIFSQIELLPFSRLVLTFLKIQLHLFSLIYKRVNFVVQLNYYLEIKDAKRAAKELDRAIELGSENPYTYYHAGFAYLSLGNPAKAVKLFEIFLEYAPYAPEAEAVRLIVGSLC